MEQVWAGIPDLRFEPDHIVSDGNRWWRWEPSVRGRRAGCSERPRQGAPYRGSMFDYVRVEDGRIVDRIQQADTFGQFRQLFGPLRIGALAVLPVLMVGLGVLIGVLV